MILFFCRVRFQEKFGMAADVYGEQGMEQVKAPASDPRFQAELYSNVLQKLAPLVEGQ